MAQLRHASQAVRTEDRRNIALLAAACAGGAAEIALLAVHGGAPVAVAGGLAGALAWAARRALWRRLVAGCGWVWRHRRTPEAFCGTGVALVAGVWAREMPLWQFAVPPLVVFVAGWLILTVGAVVAHGRAAAVLAPGGRGLRELAPPLPATLEESTARLMTMNVVTFAASRATTPLVGSGMEVRPWNLPFDVRAGATDGTGREQTVEPFDLIAFHRRLEQVFAVECMVDSTPERRLTAGHRMYVDGRAVDRMPDLLLPGEPAPLPSVSWDFLCDEIRSPERAGRRRVYFYLQESRRGGEIAVAVFVRPTLDGGRLTIEFAPQVLTPPHPMLDVWLERVAPRRRDRIAAAMRAALSRAPGAVADSPRACAARLGTWLRTRHDRLRWRAAARGGRPRNPGATLSLREGLSRENPGELDYFVVNDLKQMNDHLQARLITVIRAYLAGLGIDTSGLDASVKVNYHVQNWHIGDVRADMVRFGNQNLSFHAAEGGTLQGEEA